MGLYLTPGHTYSDTSPNNVVNGANLNEHVSEAVLKTTAISSQTLKDPAALSDELLINDGGTLKKVTMQQLYALFIQPGTVVQAATGLYTANTNLTTAIPSDDTIPQNTEGTEIISLSITPRFSTSIIVATFTGQFSGSSSQNCLAALFRDSVVGAIAGQVVSSGGLDFCQTFSFFWPDSPATTSAVSYKIRVGPAGGTMRMNGSTSGRILGGVSASTLTLHELKQ